MAATLFTSRTRQAKKSCLHTGLFAKLYQPMKTNRVQSMANLNLTILGHLVIWTTHI